MNMLVIRMGILLGMLSSFLSLLGQKPIVEDRAMLYATNLKVICKTPGGSELTIDRDVRVDSVASLEICFDLAGNQLVPSGTKPIYLLLRTMRGNVLVNATRGSGTFLYAGRAQPYSRKIDVTYVEGRNQRNNCVDFFPSESFQYGVLKAELHYEGRLIASKRLFFN